MSATPPSGQQHLIQRGDQRATVVEVGGGIREYNVGDRPVLDPYPLHAMCDGAHGTPLIPWPNRLEDGRYSFDGSDYQLALTEPEKHNAIHGLLRWQPWQAREVRPSRVVVGTRVYPQSGFPFSLDVEIDYSLGEDGLTVATTARNIGESRCPFGAGQHPYLSPGTGPVDGCVLRLDAATHVLTDPERQLPAGTEAVGGTPFDFRGDGRRLDGLRADDALCDLSRDSLGRAWAHLDCPDGRTVSLWVDDHYPVVQVFTGDTLAPPRRRLGLGCEPMTCPPNALRSGDRLLVLAAGEAVTLRWGVRLSSL